LKKSRVLAVVACAALAACSSPSHAAPAGSAAPAAPAITDPKPALAAALAGVTAGRYRWDVSFPGHHLAGAVDRPGHRGQWSDTAENQPGEVVVRHLVTGSDQYVMTTESGRPAAANGIVPDGTWEHFDLARLPKEEDPLARPDIVGITTIVHSMTAASAEGRTIHGTYDLAASGPPPENLTALVPWWQGGPQPATAELDAQGRLVRFAATLAGDETRAAGMLVIQLSGYDDEMSPPAKPTPAVEAPALIYDAS